MKKIKLERLNAQRNRILATAAFTPAQHDELLKELKAVEKEIRRLRRA